jgi:hypothetical protein
MKSAMIEVAVIAVMIALTFAVVVLLGTAASVQSAGSSSPAQQMPHPTPDPHP